MTALPLLGVIIPHLPLFPIRYHQCGRAAEMDRNTTISALNATNVDRLVSSGPALTGGCSPVSGRSAPQSQAADSLNTSGATEESTRSDAINHKSCNPTPKYINMLETFLSFRLLLDNIDYLKVSGG
jgi:hypothetical protein